MLEVRTSTRYYGGIDRRRSTSASPSRPGEVLGYLGPNGSGKSTTVKMLVGSAAADARHDSASTAQNIQDHAARLQSPGRLCAGRSARLHVSHGGKNTCGSRAGCAALPPAVLERQIDRFLRLFSLDADYQRAVVRYSKGMRQKVLLAAALLHNPADPRARRAGVGPRRRRRCSCCARVVADLAATGASCSTARTRSTRSSGSARASSSFASRQRRRRRLGRRAARADAAGVARRRLRPARRAGRRRPSGRRSPRGDAALT